MIHRDLKPANVMITPKGHVRVLDFGLARLVSAAGTDATQSIAETQGLLGTPLYMSPEQALAELWTPASICGAWACSTVSAACATWLRSPRGAADPFRRVARDFSTYRPVSDDVFHAYQVLYAYPKTPLNAADEGVVKETVDWREEKISFDTAYNGERMSAYLFLPKNVQPPYQTVLFFPSARVMFLPPNSSLGDTQFFDYILQNGRAVLYPIYQDTYDRRVKYLLPNGSRSIQLTVDWYKDAARSLDYLATRHDIDNSRLAYLGAAHGVPIVTLLQDRLKAIVFLDGGYFLGPAPPGGDQADFAPRIKKPVLMVNGRYDYIFPLDKAQNPMFDMLGTPAADKSHVVLDTPHDVTESRQQLTHMVLAWLDRYLGRVGD